MPVVYDLRANARQFINVILLFNHSEISKTANSGLSPDQIIMNALSRNDFLKSDIEVLKGGGWKSPDFDSNLELKLSPPDDKTLRNLGDVSWLDADGSFVDLTSKSPSPIHITVGFILHASGSHSAQKLIPQNYSIFV